VGIGNAGGAGGTPSVAGGSVTALHQSITATEQDGGNPENLKGLIEVNAGIQAGDSGGPLVDTGGKVVGMDSAASAGFSFQTTGTDGYAIPINSAVAIAKKIESGNASATVHVGTTAFLGVQVYSTQSGSSPSGAVIHVVVPGSPAASAGLAAGDGGRSRPRPGLPLQVRPLRLVRDPKQAPKKGRAVLVRRAPLASCKVVPWPAACGTRPAHVHALAGVIRLHQRHERRRGTDLLAGDARFMTSPAASPADAAGEPGTTRV